VDDVSGAVDLLSSAYGWQITVNEPGFGEVLAGDLRIMLSKDAMVDWGRTGGVILHDYVVDVDAAVEKAVAAGVELLQGPVDTDWGTRSALLKGPGGLIVDLCKDASP
jgi:uncharacterized glyoxalase superfamily protein PhnB